MNTLDPLNVGFYCELLIVVSGWMELEVGGGAFSLTLVPL